MSTELEDPSKGIKAWEARRKEWTTPNQHYLNQMEKYDIENKKYELIIQNEAQRIAIYKQLVHKRQVFRNPIPVKYIIPVLVTGWQEDGLWPKGMIVQDKSD
ncbi:uncharacterized protein BX663DRAFT_427472 [Cokeromyces recurvatus]|uniref:uncharacterized protein n=1 Tax=Cokeromyces recurvatus TaxID=90255 RepID=UPI00221E8AF4|nr:uncharacterized protein BX663DRAFT_427472 [Cokeromyces recurvatus]KAI7906522.1 hypothetical protein BX663DRAFT_427472 [Cokeromyces recurvatus]